MANKPIKEWSEELLIEVQKNRTVVKKLNIHDYSSVDSTISIVGADGAKQGRITPPAGVANVKEGQTFKLKVEMPSDPANLPQDGYQMVLGTSFLWKDKAATDIFNWSEMKNHIKHGDKLVLERLPDSGGFKNYQLVSWEISASSGVSVARGHWETINQTTYNFTKPLKVRITGHNKADSPFKFIGNIQKSPLGTFDIYEPIAALGSAKTFSIEYFNWNNAFALNTANKIEQAISVFEFFENEYTITKFEIWKED